jgi:small-conductance mechanosensitive channel
MNTDNFVELLRDSSRIPLVQIILIVALAWLLIFIVDRVVPWLAGRVSGRIRPYLLPSVPVIRLFIVIAALVSVIPLVIKPTPQNLLTILGATGLALGFAFKDYIGSIIAGVVAIYEHPYRPGDWVKIDGAYGEVRSLGLRALRIVTPDDTLVTIPHAKLWDSNIFNANDGARELQCIALFYLEPSHDAEPVRQMLYDVALTSPYLQLDKPITVIVTEQPGYTYYQLKAYPLDSRDQFLFISDMTVRGKATLIQSGVQFARLAPIFPSETGGSTGSAGHGQVNTR